MLRNRWRRETFNALPCWKNVAYCRIRCQLGANAVNDAGKYRRYSGSRDCVVLMIDVLDFKEVRDHMGLRCLMMAGVISVADALAGTAAAMVLMPLPYRLASHRLYLLSPLLFFAYQYRHLRVQIWGQYIFCPPSALPPITSQA